MLARQLTVASALIAGACFVAAPAFAAQSKPPIRGLVSMGAYKFVGPGSPPDNNLAAIRKKPNVFGGIVLVPSWAQLQPAKGQFQTAVIDDFLNQVRIYNARHSNKLAVKLRVWGGFMAPQWAKQIGGAPVSATHNGHARTLGRFWTPAYRAAFAQLQNKLAAKYDNEPLIREVSITQCMSFTAEPFFVPNDPSENVMSQLTKAGFNDADYQDCLSNSVGDYSAWKTSRLVLSVNPFYGTGNTANEDFTKGVMLDCRNAIGVRCVFDNHDLDNDLPKTIKPLYAYMQMLGPEIEFQTLHETPANFPATIKFGVKNGASSIELYQDFRKYGFPPISIPTLKKWSSWILQNTGEPNP